MKHVLLVEPDYMLGDNYEKVLRQSYEVTTVRSAQQAIDVIDSRSVDLIITDTLISSNNGIEILYEIRSYADWLDLPIVLLSSLPMSDFPVPAKQWGEYGIRAFAYKPKTQPSDLVKITDSAML